VLPVSAMNLSVVDEATSGIVRWAMGRTIMCTLCHRAFHVLVARGLLFRALVDRFISVGSIALLYETVASLGRAPAPGSK
jgi:hypothetical protein